MLSEDFEVCGFWRSIETVRILDPTVGSGAFLFAALNVLEPLYEACLDRMGAFIAEAERLDGDGAAHRYTDFRAILERAATQEEPARPSRRCRRARRSGH